MKIDIPSTNLTAKLEFPTRAMANDFATAWSRKTLMGHTVGGNTVEVYNVTGELKEWIADYISQLEETA